MDADDRTRPSGAPGRPGRRRLVATLAVAALAIPGGVLAANAFAASSGGGASTQQTQPAPGRSGETPPRRAQPAPGRSGAAPARPRHRGSCPHADGADGANGAPGSDHGPGMAGPGAE